MAQWPFNAWSAGSIPGWGAKLPHASWPKIQNIKHKQYYNKFSKDFKSDPHFKKILKIKEYTPTYICKTESLGCTS